MKNCIKLLLLTAACTVCISCSSANEDTMESMPETVSSTEATTETAPEVKTALKIELSGNPEDSFVAEEDCYAEGEQVVLYFQKGLTVRGDMLAIVETVMTDLCETTGLSFDPIRVPQYPMECRDMYYEPGLFSEINKNAEKINVLVIALEGDYIQWASEHNAILDISDFDYEPFCYMTIYHELVHVLQYRSGVMLGSTMDEGYAVYITDKILNEKGTRLWDTAQYFYPASFDENLIWDGETAFRSEYGRDLNYQYGFRFITFLYSTYGESVFNKILEEGTNQNFDNGYNPENEEADKAEDTRQLISIIKAQTDDEVFTKFGEWYKNYWQILASDYMSQMESMSGESQ